MEHTRRTLLKNSLVLPFFPGLEGHETITSADVIAEPTVLSQESAQGFVSVLSALKTSYASAGSNIIVLAAASAQTRSQANEWSARARAGTWVVWESSPLHRNRQTFEQQRHLLRNHFGIFPGEPLTLDDQDTRADSLYVRYLWPRVSMTRTFLSCVPLEDHSGGVIARYTGRAVAVKRRIGRGGILFLGSMLGPHLRAGDREAKEIAREMFCGGFSSL